MEKKSILCIHPFLPYPLVSGGHQALYHGLLVIKDDYDVTLAFQGEDTPEMRKTMEEFQQMMPNVTLQALLKPSSLQLSWFLQKCRGACYDCIKLIERRLKKAAKLNRMSDPTGYWKFTVEPQDPEWIQFIFQVSRRKHYDLIQIEMPWLIKDIYAMPEDTKVIHVHHELGFCRRELEMKNCTPDAYNEVCRKYVDFNEISQLNMYNAIITLSPADGKKLLDRGVKVPVYNSFALIETSTTIGECCGNGKRLSFVGYGKHLPNLTGITWFLENCWRKLKTADVGYTLDIIGKWDEDVKKDYSAKYPGVRFLGFVEDLDTAIRDSIMIVPITVGSGIRIKILEAASKGVPFISTTVGAEGIPVTNGEHCVLADDPDAFVEGIIRLQDIALRNRIVKAAHQMVMENYTVEKLKKNRLEIYNRVIQNP